MEPEHAQRSDEEEALQPASESMVQGAWNCGLSQGEVLSSRGICAVSADHEMAVQQDAAAGHWVCAAGCHVGEEKSKRISGSNSYVHTRINCERNE